MTRKKIKGTAGASAKLFDDFFRRCDRAFAFVESTYGLSNSESRRVGLEVARTYESADRKIIVYFEPFSRIWVQLERKVRDKRHRKGLHQAYQRAVGERWPISEELPQGTVYDFEDCTVISQILERHWEELFGTL
ncbi:MAG TPA: hypothetical protein VHC22_14240 [Pirellulales bacterium]|nr:hypothetical protein [Pirellulales bacterium]